MVRRLMVALAATAALGLAFVPTAASARGGHGPHASFHAGPHFSHFASRPAVFASRSAVFASRPAFAFRGGPFRFHHHHRFAFIGASFYSSDYGCIRPRLIQTAYGWQWVRVNVCGYDYDY